MAGVADSHETIGGNEEFFDLDVMSHPILNELRASHLGGALKAEIYLEESQHRGYIDLSQSKKILDFGAGTGAPTLALIALAEQNGGDVEAVEISEQSAGQIIDLGVLPPEKVHICDGFDLLKQRGANGDQFDLITAIMFGPDEDGTLAETLINSARRGLRKGGHLLAGSDQTTMTMMRQAFTKHGVSYRNLIVGSERIDILPDALIASFPQE